MKGVSRALLLTVACVVISAPPAKASRLESIRIPVSPNSRQPASGSPSSPEKTRSLLASTSCTAVLAPYSGPSLDLAAASSADAFRVCSFAWSNLLTKGALDGRQLADSVRSLDACVGSNRSWSKTNPSNAVITGVIHQPDSDFSNRRTLQENGVRSRILDEFEDVKEQTAQFCCGSDAECASTIRQTEPRWCMPPSDASSIAPCANGGAATQMTEVSWKDWQKVRMQALQKSADAASVRRNLPKTFYTIYISPRFTLSSGMPFTGLRVLAHEFGHVCVNTRRLSGVRHNDLDAFALANDLGFQKTMDGSTSRCKTTPQHEAYYRRLGGELGMADETLQCLKQIAVTSNKDRFDSGTCSWGCENEAWEEAFADWIHFHTVPENSWIPQLIPGFCTFQRDGQHALPADELDCFLKTPKFQMRMETNLGCRTP